MPWSTLASDNLRAGVVGEAARAKRRRYVDALEAFRRRLRAEYSGEPTAGPVRLTATFYLPDGRTRDPLNFAKLVCDGLKGILLTDDRWEVLRSATFEVAGIDVDAPRVVLTLAAVPAGAALGGGR